MKYFWAITLIFVSALVTATTMDVLEPHWGLLQKLCITCPIGGFMGYLTGRAVLKW